MKKALPPKLKAYSPAKQRQLDELLEKNSEGTVTPAETLRLERLVAEAEQLLVENARRLAEFSQSETAALPAAAVPVTVWVRRSTRDAKGRRINKCQIVAFRSAKVARLSRSERRQVLLRRSLAGIPLRFRLKAVLRAPFEPHAWSVSE